MTDVRSSCSFLTHKALWYVKTEGHAARFAIGHTPDVAARHYADVPALRPLHETTVAEAFREAVASAIAPIVLAPDQEAAWRRDPAQAPNVPAGSDPITLLDGEQDVWRRIPCQSAWAGWRALPAAVLGRLDCPNAVIFQEERKVAAFSKLGDAQLAASCL